MNALCHCAVILLVGQKRGRLTGHALVLICPWFLQLWITRRRWDVLLFLHCVDPLVPRTLRRSQLNDLEIRRLCIIDSVRIVIGILATLETLLTWNKIFRQVFQLDRQFVIYCWDLVLRWDSIFEAVVLQVDLIINWILMLWMNYDLSALWERGLHSVVVVVLLLELTDSLQVIWLMSQLHVPHVLVVQVF